jgi:hypothetical protein
MLTVDGLTPFAFPAGAVMVQHVSSASPPNCLHTTVVPSPGGFSAPLFCIPVLNFSIQIAQDGCGVGRIDSNGGSDFTIEEIGDTSSPTICGLPASNCATPPGDSNVQVNVEVGTNGPDTCGAGREANAAVSVPTHTIAWSHTPTINCNITGPDSTGPGGPGDATVVEFDFTLDFTTDGTSADWSDLDADGCCLAGSGPASAQACAFGGGGGGPVTASGSCIDIDGVNIAGADVTTVASGTVGSNGQPLYDLTFLANLPAETSGPSGAPTAVCGSPPLINFAGSVTRCVP